MVDPNWKAGDRLEITARKSLPGKGLNYFAGFVTAAEDGFAGGWDVWDAEDGTSFYGFSVIKIDQRKGEVNGKSKSQATGSNLQAKELNGCDQCQVVTINGVSCHETGCINSWINPVTGKGYLKECWECGCDYIPEHRVSRFGICQDCQFDRENPITEEDDEY